MPWYHIAWLTAYLITILGLSLYGVHRFVILYWYLKQARNPPPLPADEGDLPFVTVQLPIFNERFVIERLLRAVAALDYPRDRFEVQVLDDSTDDTRILVDRTVKILSDEGLQIRVVRRPDRSGFKAGALRHGLGSARGEILYLLDADFLPGPDALRLIVPYFADPEVGMVQTRWGHLNRTDSALTRIQSLFLDGHFLLEQTARSRTGRFFHFNGTAGAWRKSCIEDAGGWEADTLTEDLDLSLRAQLQGWKFIFLRDVVTPAELPVEMNAFKSQQHRWTKGAIQNARKLLRRVWTAPIPLRIKAEATVQLTCNFVYVFMLVLCLLALPVPWLSLTWSWGWLPGMTAFLCATFSVVVFYAFSARTIYPRQWILDVLHLPLLLALGVGMTLNNGRAVLEALRGSRSAFIRTPKFGHGTGPESSPSHLRSRTNTYRSLPPPTLLLEVAFSLLFSGLTALTIWQQNWGATPMLALFALGFHLVSWPSLIQWLRDEFSPEAGTGFAGSPS